MVQRKITYRITEILISVSSEAEARGAPFITRATQAHPFPPVEIIRVHVLPENGLIKSWLEVLLVIFLPTSGNIQPG